MWELCLIPVIWFLAVVLGGSLLLAAQGLYYSVRRYPCPTCGRRELRFLIFRSYPWRKTSPGPVRCYACQSCAALVHIGPDFGSD
jgi:hypothetical protein